VSRHADDFFLADKMVARAKKSKATSTSTPNKSNLIFQVGKDAPKWYTIEKTSVSPSSSSTVDVNEKYDRDKCEQAFRAECELYQAIYQQEQGSDYQWLQTSLSTTAKVRDTFVFDLERSTFALNRSRIVLLLWSH
jgi:hypothetical protein